MTGFDLLVLLLISALAAWLYGRLLDRWNERRDQTAIHERYERPSMPAELRTAQLLMSEKLLRAEIDGEEVAVKPDQVYQTIESQLIPVETKTRNRVTVYDYDRIELSVQRLALAQKYGQERVAKYGYVRVIHPDRGHRPHYIPVKLLSYEDLAALTRRWKSVVAGDVSPSSQTHPRACRGCGFRKKCPKALA